MEMEYKYFDKIDIDYIKLKNGDCNNFPSCGICTPALLYY